MFADYMFSVQDCLSVFVEYMEVKAEQLGLSNNTLFRDPCGIANYSTARDMVRCLIRGYECAPLRGAWSQPEYTVTLEGQIKRTLPLRSTVLADKCSHILTDAFEVLGGKTGTLTNYGAYNLSVIVKVPEIDELLACTVMYADEDNCRPNNRFLAAKQAITAAIAKYLDRELDTSKTEVCAQSAIVCVVPPRCSVDEYHAELDVLFEKNASERKCPASMTKMLTAVIALEYLTDPEEKICVQQAVLDAIPNGFCGDELKAGDMITVKDALHAMMLPSSNAAAYVLANHVGHRIFTDVD
ncbi:MAG: hypothetical protein J6K62_05010 [Clostridia bacterium]|nr:hypothetical protein [Clostridia bacterium]